jgi:hypothetical protein
MSRTTSELVAGVIEADVNISLTPFIDSASMIVERACAVLDYTDAELELIERWLAAHFYAARDPQLASESIKGASSTYQGQTAMYFESTVYGQRAMQLDVLGGLIAIQNQLKNGKKKYVGIDWLGTENEDSES